MKTAIDWIQLITLIGLLLGLGLVIYELRQTHQLTRVELAADGFTHLLDKYRLLMGENVAEAFAKNCSSEELSESELIQVDAYLNHIFFRGMRLYRLEELADFGQDLENIGYAAAAEYLALPRGRERFQANTHEYPQWFRDAVGRVVADEAARNCRTSPW